jgi:Met-zincin
MWVIEYGYSPALDDPLLEQLHLKKIAERSIDPKLMYGNDADDMRMSGKGIDPDVNIYDLTNDPVAYAAERCDLVNAIYPKMKDRFENNNQSYQELLQAYLISSGEYGNQIRIMTRQIGGVHYDRSYPGQGAKVRPLEPVKEEKQKQAMAALAKYAFAPDAWNNAMMLYNYLLEQRRGFDHFSKNEDPQIHERVLGMQTQCLSHLLHENVLQRITDSQLYGNTYSLDEVITDLTNAIFQADLKTEVNTFRQNLQVLYIEQLISIVQSKTKYDNVSQAVAYSELKKIETMMTTATSPNGLTKAHRGYVKALIQDAMDDK